MDVEIQRLLADLAARWNDVERRMKEIELLRREALIPAINELRYTGRKIADALLLISKENLDSAGIAQIKRELVIADNYLTNADHDITDSAILFVSLQVIHVFELHGHAKVVRYIPDFDDFYKVLKEAETIVVESRGDRQNRKAIYKKIATEHIPKLIELYKKLISHAELALPKGPVKRGIQIATIYAFIGAAAGILTFLIHLWMWHYAPHQVGIDEFKKAMRDAISQSDSR